MSLTVTMILAGAAGGAAWAGVTLAATWWFNRRVRQVINFPTRQRRVPTFAERLERAEAEVAYPAWFATRSRTAEPPSAPVLRIPTSSDECAERALPAHGSCDPTSPAERTRDQ